RGLARRPPFGRCLRCCERGPVKLGDRAQHLAAVPQQDSKVLEVLFREIADDGKVDGILGEALAVLGQPERCQPFRNATHGKRPGKPRALSGMGCRPFSTNSKVEAGKSLRSAGSAQPNRGPPTS